MTWGKNKPVYEPPPVITASSIEYRIEGYTSRNGWAEVAGWQPGTTSTKISEPGKYRLVARAVGKKQEFYGTAFDVGETDAIVVPE